MILTNCAACAAPLAHTAPRCVRCWTRYCDSTCQHDHWRRGHKQICKQIHRGGNAEQYHADKKYKEAVAAAVEACADDTKGQTCFEEANSLLCKMIPVARRVLGESHQLTLRMRGAYAVVLHRKCATLEDQREAVETLEETARAMRRVFGGAHPITRGIEANLQRAQAALRARETLPGS